MIGFDDCVFSRMSIPLLTTVQVPAEEMGKMAAQFMLNELEIKKTQYSIYLEPKIVERQSVRKIETRGETVV
ncbi:MAG: substrate-binding domain-containing protein [Ruthenibacterium lactatiformans]